MRKEASCQHFFWILDDLITQSVMADFSSCPMVCGRRNNFKRKGHSSTEIWRRSEESCNYQVSRRQAFLSSENEISVLMRGVQIELKVSKHVMYVHHFGFVSYALPIFSSMCSTNYLQKPRGSSKIFGRIIACKLLNLYRLDLLYSIYYPQKFS